ncbi:MMPL family transporter, partial [bacterium]|nr:MMPL family transporter [bacterium]
YMWSDKGNSLLMLVMPSKDFSTLSVIAKPLQRIRADIKLTELDFNSKVTAGLTGRPALQADEMATTNQDMLNASLYALIGVAVLFVFFFREVTRPALTMLTLLMAMGWTFGFVALTLGHLNLLSTVFALVLIGLGVDFGIHFLHRYQEELGSTGDPKEASLFSLQHAGAGIVTGALTSSIAFLLALFTNFLGLAELGYVAGVGILFCLAGMLITLPALLVAVDSRMRNLHIPTPVHLLGLRHGVRHPRTLIIVLIVLSVIAGPSAVHVRFDDNLLALQADNLESVEYEHKLMAESDYSTWYCAFQEPDLDGVRETIKKLKADPTVAGMESLADVMPKTPEETQPLLDSIQANLSKSFAYEPVKYFPNIYVAHRLRDRITSLLSDVERMKQQAEQAQQAPSGSSGGMSLEDIPQEQLAMMSPEQIQQLKAMQEAAQSGQAVEVPKFEISESEQARLDQLKRLADALSGNDEALRNKLSRANVLLFENARTSLKKVAQWAAAPAPTPEMLPHEFQMMYVGNDGSLLVMAFPKEDIWITENMAAFVGAMRNIDTMVTGTPIQVYESSNLMRNAFMQVGLLSLVAVAVMVFLDFLSITALFFVMGPLLLGVFWMMCIMGEFSLHLNFANFFAIPILIGIGVDNAVHFYHRFEETHDVEKAMYTT